MSQQNQVPRPMPPPRQLALLASRAGFSVCELCELVHRDDGFDFDALVLSPAGGGDRDEDGDGSDPRGRGSDRDPDHELPAPTLAERAAECDARQQLRAGIGRLNEMHYEVSGDVKIGMSTSAVSMQWLLDSSNIPPCTVQVRTRL